MTKFFTILIILCFAQGAWAQGTLTPVGKPSVNPAKVATPSSALVQTPVAKTAGTLSKKSQGKNPQVLFKTTMGDFTVELNPEKAPISVKNFLSYVNRGYYKGTIFHRVIRNFMIQGGGFTKDMVKKSTDAPIKLEAGNGLSNIRGTIAMARTNVRDSATSQFFINVKNNRNLDNMGGGYAVFGKVINGMENVEKIRNTATGQNGRYRDVPTQAIIILDATRIN